jgi:hypothetical protein
MMGVRNRSKVDGSSYRRRVVSRRPARDVPLGLVDDLRLDDRPEVLLLPAGRLVGSVKVGAPCRPATVADG